MQKQILIITLLAIGFNLFSQNRLNNGEQIFLEQHSKALLQTDRSLTSNIFSWENEINISNNEGEDSRYPRMCVGNDGTIYAVFTERGYQSQGYAANQKIVFAKKEVGENWTEQIVIDENGYPSKNNSISAIAVDEDNNIHVVFLSWAFENWRNVMVYTKFDNDTQTWLTPVEISTGGGSIYDTHQIQIVLSDTGNPLVIWGEDNRIDENTEKVYGTYFDGSTWSADILISGDDTLGAVQPVVEKIDENKAMIVYKKEVLNEADSLQLEYGFFDFNNNTFSSFSSIPNTKTTKYLSGYNFDIEYAPIGSQNNLFLAHWTHEYPVEGNLTDKINIINYNINNNTFLLSEHELSFSISSSLYKKTINLACNSESELSVIYNSTQTHNIEVSNYNNNTGFSISETISTDPSTVSNNYPSVQFNPDNKLCIVFTDERNYTGSGYIERDVFFREGTNIFTKITTKKTNNKFSIYPNPANTYLQITGISSQYRNIRIYDITGKLVNRIGIQNSELTIQIKDLDKGIYFIKAGNQTTKLIKQ